MAKVESRAGRACAVADRVGKRWETTGADIAALLAGRARASDEQTDSRGRQRSYPPQESVQRHSPPIPQIPRFLLCPVPRIDNGGTIGVTYSLRRVEDQARCLNGRCLLR